MRSKTAILVAAFAMVLAACSPSEDASQEETTTTAGGAATTTQAAGTTTEGPAATTTTMGGDSEDFEAFLASLADSQPTSARVEGLIEITGLPTDEGGPSEATIAFSASYDNETGDNSFLMDMSALAASMPSDPNDPFGDMADLLGNMEVRQIGDTVYMNFPFFTAFLGSETDWISMPAEDSGDFTSGFNMAPGDPNEIIDAYRDTPGTLENLGNETVNGVNATHYRITYDLEQLEMTPEERAELEGSGLFADGVLPMDIWISDEGYMVRMRLEVDGSTMDAPPDEQFEHMSMQYDLFDINQPVSIEAPPADQVTDIADLEFGFGFGGTDDTTGG